MKKLVFIEPDKIDAVPFTTSQVISDFSQVGHKKIKEALAKNKTAIESFGLLAPYETESTGGRPEVIYKLNEQQATFLMTLLKNTPIVVEFKRRLVEQFYLMRAELTQRKINRLQGKPLRRELTDIIREKPDHGEWDYKLYTDLAYILVTGRSAIKLRRERNAPRDAVAADYLTADELKKVNNLTPKIGMLYELGMDYKQIKALLSQRLLIGKVS